MTSDKNRISFNIYEGLKLWFSDDEERLVTIYFNNTTGAKQYTYNKLTNHRVIIIYQTTRDIQYGQLHNG